MNPSLAALQQQREQVVEDMSAIDQLRRGTLSQHFLHRLRDGKTLTHGPYFVLQGYLRGKKFSHHIPAEQVEKVAAHVGNFQRFQELAERFVTLTDQITRLSDGAQESKKNSRRRKSPTAGSEKPRPS
ncbi:MAG: DUF6788 family protein [Opitutaceae bacterium]|jgi:hypothetical protein